MKNTFPLKEPIFQDYTNIPLTPTIPFNCTVYDGEIVSVNSSQPRFTRNQLKKFKL